MSDKGTEVSYEGYLKASYKEYLIGKGDKMNGKTLEDCSRLCLLTAAKLSFVDSNGIFTERLAALVTILHKVTENINVLTIDHGQELFDGGIEL